MLELKRILTLPSKIILLTLLIIINIFLFIYYQNDKYKDTNLYSEIYTQELEKIEKMESEEAVSYLEEQKEYYSMLNELILYLKNTEANGITVYSEELMDFYDENLDLVEKIKNGTISETEEEIKETVFTKLLEQALYINNYPQFIESVEENKTELLSFSIFNKEGTFSYKNILKTAEDYNDLKDVQLKIGNYTVIEDFSNYEIVDILIFLSIIIIVVSFIDDRKKGLKDLINSTKNGRRKLTMNRTITLFICSALSVVIFYGTVLGISLLTNGGLKYFDNLILSVPLFQTFTMAISIKRYILLFLVARILSMFLIGLIIWYIISKIKNIKLSFLIMILIFALEYLAYTMIDFNSYASIFKAINIFSLFYLNNCFINYININFMGMPISYLYLVFMMIGVGIFIFLLLHLLMSIYEKSIKIKILEKIKNKFLHIIDLIINKFTLVLYEMYKIIFMQKGWVILLIFLYIIIHFNFIGYDENAPSIEEQIVSYYSEQYEGVANESLLAKLEEIEQNFQNTTEDFIEQEEKYKKGMLDYYEYYTYKIDNDQAVLHISSLEQLKDKVSDLIEKNNTLKNKLWILNETPVNNAYGENSYSKQETVMFIMAITLILLFASSLTFESESNMNMLLNTMKNNKKLMKSKVISALLITSILWLITSSIEISQFINTINIEILSAPVWSLDMLSWFPININLATFLCLVYIVRLIFYLCVTSVILYISSKVKKSIWAYIISLVIAISILIFMFNLII